MTFRQTSVALLLASFWLVGGCSDDDPPQGGQGGAGGGAGKGGAAGSTTGAGAGGSAGTGGAAGAGAGGSGGADAGTGGGAGAGESGAGGGAGEGGTSGAGGAGAGGAGAGGAGEGGGGGSAGGGASGGGGTGGVGGGAGQGGGGGSGPPTLLDGTVRRYDYRFNLVKADFHSGLEVEVAPPGGNCFEVSCGVDTLGGVTWNGAPANSSTIADGALEVCGSDVSAPGPLQVEASGVLELGTFLGLDVGFSRTADMAGGQFTYLLSWVGGCDHFGPCDDAPSRLSAFHFEVTHPAGTTVLCPGALEAGSTTTRCDVAGTLAPTYSAFALAADPLWQRKPFTQAAGVDLVFYEVPGGDIATSLNVASVTEFMGWITSLLGPFPYGNELRFAGAPTVWLGFEHPANIILYEGLGGLPTSYADTAMHVLMHEVTHQWAGDRATLATAEDFVWKEATAEYLAYVFEDEHRPPAEAAASRAYWDSISLFSNHYPRPTDAPSPSVESFYGDVYGPGPMTLYVQLEALIGRAAVLAGIKAFLAEPGARSVLELRDALAAASGQNLGPYFDAWVFGQGKPEWPAFAVSTVRAGDQVTVRLTQQNPSGKLYGSKVEVRLAGAGGANVIVPVDFGLAPTSASASTTVTFAPTITTTTVDPNHRIVNRVAGATLAPATSAKPKVWIF